MQESKSRVEDLIKQYIERAPPGGQNGQVHATHNAVPKRGAGAKRGPKIKKKPSAWNLFLSKYLKDNPNMQFKEAAKAASIEWKAKGGVASAPQAVAKAASRKESPAPLALLRPEELAERKAGGESNPNTQSVKVPDQPPNEMEGDKPTEVVEKVKKVYEKRQNKDLAGSALKACEMCKYVGERLGKKVSEDELMELLRDEEIGGILVGGFFKYGIPLSVGGEKPKPKAKKPLNNYMKALKQWNSKQPSWCVPRKGSSEYQEVMAIKAGMDKKDPPKKNNER